MSFTASKTVTTIASRLLRANKIPLGRTIPSTASFLNHRHTQTTLTFSRSMWFLSAGRSPVRNLTGQQAWNKPCGCCGMKTTGDQELVEFLKEEISHEKKIEKKGALPTVAGFQATTDGSHVTLVKEKDGEKITIELDVNNSVEDSAGLDYEDQPPSQDETPAEMVSRPSFTVKISKGGEMTLAIQCDFPTPEGYQPTGENEDMVDAIEITEVAMLKGEWDEKVYSVSGTVMDGNLYDMIMNMLEERGIDGTCVEEIVEFCTAYDHKLYISFLENLKSFTDSN